MDECETEQNLCGFDHDCENTLGSFECKQKQKECDKGFELIKNGSEPQCFDINECYGFGLLFRT